MHNLLGIRNMDKGVLDEIIKLAKLEKQIILQKKPMVQSLTGKRVVLLFYENSTRTRLSFELAAKLLGATVVHVAAQSSSVQKGESFLDTVKTMEAMKTDCIVVRHPVSGIMHTIEKATGVSLVNAGDGTNEHPTQGLLDLLTLQEYLGDLRGKKILIVGDIQHSRVARSDIWGLQLVGAKITVSGPRPWIPKDIASWGISYEDHVDHALHNCDAVIALRIQKERQDDNSAISWDDYNSLYGINDRIMASATSKPCILHPGPVNRGMELTSSIVDGSFSRITDQVLNGVAVRIAVLKMILGGYQ